MAVYVDGLKACRPWGKWRQYRQSCHLFADTLRELHVFAGSIGLKREWAQTPAGGRFPHYDLTPSKRKDAVAGGAVEVDAGFVARFSRQPQCPETRRLLSRAQRGASHARRDAGGD